MATGPAIRPAAGASKPHSQPGTADALLELLSTDRQYLAVTVRPDLAGLAAVQGSMMRNYFRLLRAQEQLEHRARGSRPAIAATVVEQLEIERSRLAHELHATAGQALAGIKIHLELIDACLANPPEQVRASLLRIGLLAQEALQQLRSIARRIHPPDWQRANFTAALERLWEVTGVAQKFQARLELAPLAGEPPHYLRVLLYRVAQEALANAVRHSGATALRLWLARTADGRLQLGVEDNGAGFDAVALLEGPAPVHAGIGLRSMRDQLQLAGGELRVESGDWGTRLTAWVPESR